MYSYASNGIKTVVIIPDPDPLNPREDYDNLGTMVCWHRRHRLGDDHNYKDPQDFAIDMVLKNMKEKEVLSAIKNGDLPEFRLLPGEKEGEYAVEGFVGLIPGKEKWERMDWKVSKDMEIIESEDASFDLQEDILDWCSTQNLLSMWEKQGSVAILPLFLYDHSGISMSTGSFLGRAPHARWDSGQVGFIYMDKKTAMAELAMEAGTIRLAQQVRYPEPVVLARYGRNPGQTTEDLLAKNDFTPISAAAISNIHAMKHDNPAEPILDPSVIENGRFYRKGYKLYTFEKEVPDGAVTMMPVATFNPDLKSLTEEAWKARAEEVLSGEVKSYDNYLTGEVYGVETYEGKVLMDSCWGYNPGAEDITDCIAAEYSGWFESSMHFETDYDESFNIDGFFEDHDFPEAREQIAKSVREEIELEAQSAEVYPFGIPASELLAEGNAVFKAIVDALYEEHGDYDSDHFFEVIAHFAGYSRELQPKVTAKDLEPGRDYTADEIMEVFNKKPSLKDMIAQAAAKKGNQSHEDKGLEPTR